MSNEQPTFVIGDVHGHYDRLAALLQHAGILGDCEACDGTGDATAEITFESGISVYADPKMEQGQIRFESAPPVLCPYCDGDGIVRTNFDARVIQLGDLGHFGGATGSPTGDYMCYRYADRWLDTILWGNHDRAVVDSAHAFKGYMHPGGNTKGLMDDLYTKGKLKVAATAHGYLIVHAGVALGWYRQTQVLDNVEYFTDRLNSLADAKLAYLKDKKSIAYPNGAHIIDAVGLVRGGAHPMGGVLWMDWGREKHLQGEPFKFICGHTAQKDGEVKEDEYGNYCIDIGGKDNGRLAGVWLDDGEVQETVAVNLNYKEKE